jgi:hypothetical protein
VSFENIHFGYSGEATEWYSANMLIETAHHKSLKSWRSEQVWGRLSLFTELPRRLLFSETKLSMIYILGN